MIFEMRTYLLKPGSYPELEKRFGAGIDARTKLSRFGGLWRSEVGTLNQIIHVWAYKNMGERDKIRADAVAAGIWPPPRHESVTLLKQLSTLAVPASWSPLR